MRSLAITITLATALAASAVSASFGEGDYGIAAWDRKDRVLWINGEESYNVPAGLSTNGLMNGDTVKVTWQQQGGERVATRITVTQRRADSRS